MNDPNFSDEESPEDHVEQLADEPVLDDSTSPVMAELAAATASYGGTINPYLDKKAYSTPPLDLGDELKNLSATGGAVGGLVLGTWSIISAMITFFAFINAGLAILLGLYGLSSPRKKLAVAGIVLGVIGLFMSFMEISEWVGGATNEETMELENF